MAAGGSSGLTLGDVTTAAGLATGLVTTIAGEVKKQAKLPGPPKPERRKVPLGSQAKQVRTGQGTLASPLGRQTFGSG